MRMISPAHRSLYCHLYRSINGCSGLLLLLLLVLLRHAITPFTSDEMQWNY